MHTWNGHAILLGGILLLTPASAQATGTQQGTLIASDIVKQIDQDLRNLTANLARLETDLREGSRRPTPADPTLRALFDLHRAGWDLHRKQWIYQREHLQFAREQLQRAKTTPEERASLLEQWRKHEQTFEAGMANFRREREAMEQQHLKLEGELIERELAGDKRGPQ